MKYEEFSLITKSEAESILEKKNIDSNTIIKTIILCVKCIDDYDWLQKLCLKYINNEDYWVQKAAINGLGDIVRIYRKLNSLEDTMAQLDEVAIGNPLLVAEIDNLKDDISIFRKISD